MIINIVQQHIWSTATFIDIAHSCCLLVGSNCFYCLIRNIFFFHFRLKKIQEAEERRRQEEEERQQKIQLQVCFVILYVSFNTAGRRCGIQIVNIVVNNLFFLHCLKCKNFFIILQIVMWIQYYLYSRQSFWEKKLYGYWMAFFFFFFFQYLLPNEFGYTKYF